MRIWKVAVLAGLVVVVAGGLTNGRLGGIARAQAGRAQEIQRYVSVLDGDRPVLGLETDDFVVEEDHERREVLRVEPVSLSLDIAILVDDGMVASANLGHIREALTSLVRSLLGHNVSLVGFGNQRRTVVPFTRDIERLTEATSTYAGFSESSAYLLEAMVETAHDLARLGGDRPAMIVLTTEGRGMGDMAIRGPGFRDNRLTPDTVRDRSAESVVDMLKQVGAVVHAVVFTPVTQFGGIGFQDSRNSGLATITSGGGGFRWIQENRERERVIDKAPTDTGGRLYKVSTTSGIQERLLRIADELINQYLVTYARPATLVPPDEIRVDVVDDDLTVRSTASLVYIPEVPTTVYVMDGTVVAPDMVYHHSPDCPGFGGLGGQNALAVPLDALGDNGTFCPYCPNRSKPK